MVQKDIDFRGKTQTAFPLYFTTQSFFWTTTYSYRILSSPTRTIGPCIDLDLHRDHRHKRQIRETQKRSHDHPFTHPLKRSSYTSCTHQCTPSLKYIRNAVFKPQNSSILIFSKYCFPLAVLRTSGFSLKRGLFRNCRFLFPPSFGSGRHKISSW